MLVHLHGLCLQDFLVFLSAPHFGDLLRLDVRREVDIRVDEGRANVDLVLALKDAYLNEAAEAPLETFPDAGLIVLVQAIIDVLEVF